MGYRRLARALTVAAVAATALVGPVAEAQTPQVRMVLGRQTPWVTLRQPILHLDLVATTRADDALQDLAVTIAVGPAIRSRSEYERALQGGPPFTAFARTFSIDGEITPGQARRISVEMDTSTILPDDDSLVYPAGVSLLSQGAPLATIFTPVLKLVRAPAVPVGFSWWTELSSGPVFDPAGHLAVRGIERAIAPGGRLFAAAEALGRIVRAGQAFDLVVEPALLEQLGRMADGYLLQDGTRVEAGTGAAADAAALLAALRAAAAAPGIRVVGLPFAAPGLPTMLRSGLASDLAAQETFGSDRLQRALGVDGRGPVSATPRNELDPATLDHLATEGATTVLAAEDAVTRPEEADFFAPPPAADVAAGGETLTLILPDPDTQALFSVEELRDDPVRLAQAVLCELAVIWREQPVPVPPTVRGIAVRLPRDLPPGVWAPLVDRLAAAPFLAPMPADELARSLEPSPVVTQLATRDHSRFSAAYVAALRREGAAIDAFASMLAAPSPAPERLRRNLFFAESSRYIGDEIGGRAWYDAIHRRLAATFAGLAPLPDQRFTFTSDEGTIQVALGNPGPVPVQVGVEFHSTWFRFPSGDRSDVTIEQPGQVVPMDVAATARGRRPIRVLIRAPNGTLVAEGNVLVASTGANRIALVITVAAALGLVALWSRRILRRMRS